MHTTHFWNKFIIYGYKGLITLLLIFSANSVFGQKNFDINLPNYDEKWIHYGFLIGVHR